MLTRRTALTAALAASLLLPSCTSNTIADGPEKPPRENLHVEAPTHRPPPPSPAQRAAVAKSSNALGVDLMKTVGRSPGNYVLSPMSISMALSMAFAGASGDTEAEMRRVLHLEGSVAEIAAASGGYIQAMEELPAPLTLRIANRLFGERSVEFDPTFVGLTNEGFGAPLVRVDFLGAPDAARVAINDWAAYETEQHITGLLPEGSVTTDSRLVLANAVYFLGSWSSPFEASDSREKPFTKPDGGKVAVQMMRQTEDVQHAALEGLSAISLGYKGAPLSMLIVLPDAPDGLPGVESSLDAAKLDRIVAAMGKREVRMSVPRFEISPSSSIALRDVLGKLGMTRAFDPGAADFSAMSRSTKLRISDVFHKAFIKVTEEGTEAAAATGVVMAAASASPVAAPPIVFEADHPFLFFVRDDASGAILFSGRVENPAER